MKFVEGDRIRSKEAYGEGVVLKTDDKSKDFAVLCRFNDKGRTFAWVSEKSLRKIDK